MIPDGVELVFRPKPEDVREILRRSALVIGQPFVELPNRPPEHKVLAIIGGTKVRREHVEMVFNDTVLTNFVYREAGHQSEDSDPPGSPMAELRVLARQLYGDYGRWVEETYGVICIECRSHLPSHKDHCGVPARRRKNNQGRP